MGFLNLDPVTCAFGSFLILQRSYHDMLNGKEVLKLDEILSSDDEAFNFYMVKQYIGYCKYLDKLNKEYREIARGNGYFDSNKDKKPLF